MSIKLLNEGSIYDGFEFWKRSRINRLKVTGDRVLFYKDNDIIEAKDKEAYMKEVLTMNLSYNEFVYFEFEIVGSLLFRDFMFSFSNIIDRWAESTRFNGNLLHPSKEYIDPQTGKVMDELKNIWNIYEVGRQKFEKGDITFDQFRLDMPYSAETIFWIGINLKNLSRMLSLMRKEFYPIYKVYAPQFFNEVEGLKEFFESYYDSTGVEDSMYQYFSDGVSDPYGGRINWENLGNIGFILYSQLIRQSGTIFRGYFDLLRNIGLESHNFTGKSIVKVECLQTEKRRLATAKIRSCWFSMSDASSGKDYSWSKILESYFKSTPDSELPELLPCSPKDGCIGNCKFKQDLAFRNVNLESQHLPCAFLLEDYKLIEDRARENGNSVTIDFYRKVWRISGMKDNPSNDLRLKYEELNGSGNNLRKKEFGNDESSFLDKITLF